MSDTIDLTLDGMAHGGSAVGTHRGQRVFVPYSIPGERVQARISGARGNAVTAEGVLLLEASADRVYPGCPHFGPGRCSGCQWQHIDARVQPLLKQDVLADQLERLGKLRNPPVRPIVAAPQPWGYQHHMTFRPAPGGGWGFPSADGRGVWPVDLCPILHPLLNDFLGTLDLPPDGLASMRVQVGSDERVMLVLGLAAEDAPEVLLDVTASVNVLSTTNVPMNLIGDAHSTFTVRGQAFRATAGSAFRPNVAALDAMAEAVLSALGDAATVLDAYAGVGLWGALAAQRASLVALVESYPPAATDADANTAAFAHIEVVEGAVEEVLPALDARFDALIVDPPPQGLRTGLDVVAGLGAPLIVYVSADPASLARDAAALAGHGYALEGVTPFDMAPQTYYVDAVARFVRPRRSEPGVRRGRKP